jgi:hypothetical protein
MRAARRSWSTRWLIVPVLAGLGCAAAPRPRVLSQADETAKTAGASAAALRAPEAFAHAEKLRADAESSYRRGDGESAQILAERAIAAYHHALVLARIAVARDRALHGKTALGHAQQVLADTEAEQQRVAAEADALELRALVIRDAAPLAASGVVDASRDAVRLRAARSLALDARLLCAAARLLGGTGAALMPAENAADELEGRLRSAPRPAPIDAAMHARALCLAALTETRRPATAKSSLGRSDQLLADLSAMGGLDPTRDERGVVVTLPRITGKPSPSEGERLASLARIAQAHPAFPLEVVVHDDAAEQPPAAARADGEVIAAALQANGVSPQRIWVHAAGNAHPLAGGARTGGERPRERAELIFVDPGG